MVNNLEDRNRTIKNIEQRRENLCKCCRAFVLIDELRMPKTNEENDSVRSSVVHNLEN
jgi:hypothetical protein